MSIISTSSNIIQPPKTVLPPAQTAPPPKPPIIDTSSPVTPDRGSKVNIKA